MNDDPPAYLAFLLGLAAGLRWMEIDRLQWPAFDWDRKVIKIRRTKVFQPKTETAVRDVWIDPEVLTVFRNEYAIRGSSGSFVIEGLSLSAPDKNYRAKAVFDRLSSWLKEHGGTALKPLHELRKEFGSMVNRLHGLSAAKDLLGHADIGITALITSTNRIRPPPAAWERCWRVRPRDQQRSIQSNRKDEEPKCKNYYQHYSPWE